MGGYIPLPEAAAVALWSQALPELTQLYSFCHDIIPQDQDLLYPTVEVHLVAHTFTSVLRNWLSTNRTLIVSSAKEAARHALRGFRSLTTYYQPANPTIAAMAPPVSRILRVPVAPPWRIITASVGTD
jgi:hypothetical protein